MNNDLLWIIQQEDEEIDYYLSEVTKDQFKKDVNELLRRGADKELIRQAIKYLSEFINEQKT